jgi:hypothetical protein
MRSPVHDPHFAVLFKKTAFDVARVGPSVFQTGLVNALVPPGQPAVPGW